MKWPLGQGSPVAHGGGFAAKKVHAGGVRFRRQMIEAKSKNLVKDNSINLC